MEDLVEAHQVARLRNGKQAKRHAIQDRENTDVHSNAKCDGEYSCNRQPWTAPHGADTESQVLQELLQPLHVPHSPGLLFDARHVAELSQRRISRLVRGHSAVDIVLGFAFEMFANGLFEVRQHAFASRHASSCPPGLRICAIARASLSHLPVSTVSCCRPLAVSA